MKKRYMAAMRKPLIRLCVLTLFLSLFTEQVPAAAATYARQEGWEQQAHTEDKVMVRDNTSDGQNMPLHLSAYETGYVTPAEENNAQGEITPVTPPGIAVNFVDGDYGNKTVTLEWESIENTSGYVIVQETENGWEEVSRTASTKGAVSIAQYGKQYRYIVQAYDDQNQLARASEEIEIVIPRRLKKLHTTALSKTKVKLGWKKSKGANAYQIYKKGNQGNYQLVKTVKKTHARLKVKNNAAYRFKVIPIFMGSIGVVQSKADSITFRNKEFVSLDHQKYSYSEMKADIQSLCQKYSEYVSCKTIGYSERGRKIYDVILGNPKAKKTLLVVSAIHAREYITTAVCMKQLEYYLLNYNKIVDGKKLSKVFRNCNVHYVMMANPDGVTISQTSRSTWKGNANGVNLNLNFPYAFKSAGRKKDNSYSGKRAASESETKAIIKLSKKLKKTQMLAVVNYHAMGRIVFGSYNGKKSSLRTDIASMYSIARKTTGYASARGYRGISNGNYREYLSYKLKIPSVTIEMGSVACPVPQYQYAGAFSQNKLIVLREASWLSKKKEKK